jgi:hypothetical protein
VPHITDEDISCFTSLATTSAKAASAAAWRFDGGGGRLAPPVFPTQQGQTTAGMASVSIFRLWNVRCETTGRMGHNTMEAVIHCLLQHRRCHLRHWSMWDLNQAVITGTGTSVTRPALLLSTTL